MAYKKNSTVSGTKSGVRSPMCGYMQNENTRTPGIGTTEVMRGTAPTKLTPIQSPNKSKASKGV